MAFHTNNGLFFIRQDDGSVWVEKRVPCIGIREEYTQDFAIVERWRLDESTWASVVASMSARGETGETYQQARGFHAGRAATVGVGASDDAVFERLERGRDERARERP